MLLIHGMPFGAVLELTGQGRLPLKRCVPLNSGVAHMPALYTCADAQVMAKLVLNTSSLCGCAPTDAGGSYHRWHG